MKLIKNIKKTFVVLLAVVVLFGGFATISYAAGKKSAGVETQKSNSKISQNKKQEKEYAKWDIKEVNGIYFYKQKSVRLLIDDAGEKAETNCFIFCKKGEVDIKIVRSKKGKIKKIKYISKKRAEEMLNNCTTAYFIDKK